MKTLLLWLLVIGCALFSLRFLTLWLNPGNPPIEQVGGTELVYAFDPKTLPPNASPAELASRTSSILQDRIDPDHSKRITFRVVDDSHIQIRIPRSPNAAQVDDVKRNVLLRGILDFRIVVTPNEIGTDRADAEMSLRTNGPGTPVKANGTTARWLEMDFLSKNEFAAALSIDVTAFKDGTAYILCYDDHDHALTHADPQRRPWSLSTSNPISNGGAIELPFRFDKVGADYMGDFSTANLHRFMAILIDNRVLTRYMIWGKIEVSGTINLGGPSPSYPIETIRATAKNLQQAMNTRVLPATLLANPVREREVAPIPNYHPFPWNALLTLAPLPILLIAVFFARKPSPKNQPAPSARTEPIV